MPDKVVNLIDIKIFQLLVTGAAVLSTIAINPFTGLDPINLPKMLVLASLSFALIPMLIANIGLIKSVNRVAILLSLIFLFTILLVPLFSEASFQSQLWGAFGRSTGILTYVSYVILFISVAMWAAMDSSSTINALRVFERTTYFITFYTIIQYAGLDPINWSQSLPFATLGNINFMSAFLGLANCLFISRLIFQKSLISSQIFYLLMVVLNSSIIWFTGSIQGLAIMIVTTLASLIVLSIQKKKFLLAGVQLLLSITFGTLSALGSVARGPLSGYLYQETVVYRLDYWKAGIAMFIQNPFLGVGIDNYGERYREFRDYAATVRTGPARISNTAHNVFIDLLSGGGVLVGGTFFGLVVLGLFVSAYKSVSAPQELNYALLFPLNLGFFVFCMISIGQIGVVVWGIIFCAFSVGRLSSQDGNSAKGLKRNQLVDREKRFANKSNKHQLRFGQVEQRYFRWPKGLAFLVSFAVGFSLALIPNKADSDFLTALKSQSVAHIESSTQRWGITDFHHEKFLQFLIDRSEFDAAIRQALITKKEYPRNFFANSSLLYLPNVPKDAMVAAAKVLPLLDPNNYPLISDARKVLPNS